MNPNFKFNRKRLALCVSLSAAVTSCWLTPFVFAADTPLADQPLFGASNVPGNLALVLSVEYPTAVSVAHTNRTYAAANTYLGYFDADKCYLYRRTDGASTDNYFYPSSASTGHVCSGKWSGNFLNWASMQTIDPFRWALTGGYRITDTTAMTVVEKAWASGQGAWGEGNEFGNFPNRQIANAEMAGATPFPNSWTEMKIRVWGLGNKMRFAVRKTSTPQFGFLDAATATHYDETEAIKGAVEYEVFIRAKVCDATVGVETNCKAYGTNFKPEGLMQQYATKIRYSAFGYLNDSNQQRDGGVLRARQKYIGPTEPVPGSVAVSNSAAEWDAATGIFTLNPDAADATETAAVMGLPKNALVKNSGAMNYVNKFGQITPGDYKGYDNVSELYYAAIRYFKNQPDVAAWTSTAGASDADKIKWTDGFPVIVSPPDPILYSCQRNFILGIGDVNAWADKNLPGRVQSELEPALEPEISADTTVDATKAANKVGELEGLGDIGSQGVPLDEFPRHNSYGIAGLAYDAHTKDIRPDVAGKANTTGMQTIDTYWVDVQEYQQYLRNNQFYLATKYGGFTVPPGYSTYGNTTPLPLSWWSTNGQTNDGVQPRPDNYYSGGRPDLAIIGLNSAFAKISAAIAAYTSSFSAAVPQVSLSGNSSFSSRYDPNNWTGEVTAGNLSFDATTGEPSVTQTWNFTDVLAAQAAGTGWDTGRRIATWNGSTGVPFRADKISTADLAALDTAVVVGDDSGSFLNYLRGDQSNEVSSTATASKRAYRDRAKLLGDIVGSKAKPVGSPSYPYSDTNNPGYAKFKSDWATRRTAVYVSSNDGMMHAINGALVTTATAGLESDAAAGSEMFAYVPRSTFQGPNATPNVDGLASLAKPVLAHHHLVNATPGVYDIDFAATQGNSGAPSWRSVLIGGMGKGGKAYYAIDVTDPASMVAGGETAVAAKVLWEFSDSAMGYTFGDPIVTKVRKYGWVVIFSSGFGNSDGRGYFLIVNPRTGALLEKISTGAGTVTSEAGLSAISGFVVDASDGTSDSAYGGDLLGNLWRLDLTGTSGSYPAPQKIATLTDASGAAQPVTARPVIEIHPTLKKRFVMVGTGRLLDSTDISRTQAQTFYAITDGSNAQFNTAPPSPMTFPVTRSTLQSNTNALTSVAFDPTTQMGWYEDIGTTTSSDGVGWRMVADATTLAGTVAFAAILPNASVCSPSGDSRVYGRDYASGATSIQAPNSGATTPTLFVSQAGIVTDLRYLSVRGKAELISGTDTGTVGKIKINPIGGPSLRRLNWRELQIVN
jgi:type IV pilus assembly protein PilY1